MSIEEFKRQILSILAEKKLTKEELRKALNFRGEENQDRFEEVLEELQLAEKIYLNDKGFYNIFDIDKALVKGKIYIDKAGKGHFIGEKDGKKVRYLITNKYLNGALDNDIVLVRDRKFKRYDCNLGKVEKIFKRNPFPELFVYIGDGKFKLYNEHSEIYLKIDEAECENLVLGTLVVASINETPIEKNIYKGKIQKICGHIDDPQSLILATGLKYGFDNDFSAGAMQEVEKIPIFVTNEDIKGRVDLREERVFTIDGSDTKDIDDSISIKETKDGFVLKVNIADVSHYIEKGSALDEEALRRGNSVYPADTVFPMFPHTISNGICSLNPKVDRLTITGEITFDKDFEIIGFKLYESVINSKKQMTYDNVNKILMGEEVEGYEEYKEDLILLNKLSKKLERQRKAEGALDFYDNEFKIMTDSEGKVTDVKLIERGPAEKLIENLMIIMNTETANTLNCWGYQIAYRVHPNPNIKCLLVTLEELKKSGIENENLNKLLIELNKSLNGKELNTKSIRLFLDSIKEEPYYETVSNLILRSMKRAFYSGDNIGHFGLANDNYIHFTSPIRRYADLTNHRIAKQIMKYRHKPTAETYESILEELEKIEKTLPEICSHISDTEWRADKVEEEVDKIKQIEYFENHIEEYEGPIKAKILNISRSGIIAKVADIFEVVIPADNLRLSNFKYRKESRTYENKIESISLEDEIYLFNPEVFKEKNLITYTEVSKDPNNLFKETSKKLIKSKNINS